MDAGKRSRDVKAVAGRTALGLHADHTDPVKESSQVVGNVNQLGIKLVVLDSFEYLMVPVQAAVKPVMGPAP